MCVWRPARPAKPRPPHQWRNTVPTTAIRCSTRAKTMQSTNLQNHWYGGKSWAALGAPCQHRDLTSARAANLEPEHATGCNSMLGPSGQWDSTSGTPPSCSGETCSLSGKTMAPQWQQLVPPAMRRDATDGACHATTGVYAVGVPCCPFVWKLRPPIWFVLPYL